MFNFLRNCYKQFQSTLPVWGATALPPARYVYVTISIHAPRVGSDCWGNEV